MPEQGWHSAWNGAGCSPKNALPMALQAVPERGWYGAWNGVGCSPKNALPMALQAVPERGWYGAWNGAGCSPKNALPMALQVVPERGWYGAWNGVGCSPKNALPMALQVVPERGLLNACNGVFLWMNDANYIWISSSNRLNNYQEIIKQDFFIQKQYKAEARFTSSDTKCEWSFTCYIWFHWICNMNQNWKRLRIVYLPPAIVVGFKNLDFQTLSPFFRWCFFF